MMTAKRILVVDDEAALLNVVCFRLAKTGYEVFRGADGREALDMARRIMPDLIILDLYLPIMNGDAVVKILRSDEKLKGIPVILMSATIRTLAKVAGLVGAGGYLTKPFEPEDLISMINKLLEPSGGSKNE